MEKHLLILNTRIIGNHDPVYWELYGNDLEVYLEQVNTGEHALVLKISKK